MSGYGITCDPGDLYNRKCYVTDPTDPSKKQEIIGYTAGGDPISKAQSTVPWMAWVPTVTTLDQSGNAYQPYGQAGIPYTQSGSTMKWMPSSGADIQDYTYLDQSMPGSFSRWMTENRLCNPLWSNVFGFRRRLSCQRINDSVSEMNGYIELPSINMVPLLAAAAESSSYMLATSGCC